MKEPKIRDAEILEFLRRHLDGAKEISGDKEVDDYENDKLE